MSTPNVKARKSKSVFFKPVVADFKALFAALGKGIGHTATGKWEELGSDAIATLSSLGLQTDPGELAWLLIRRALTRALFELVGESASLHLVDVKKTAADLEVALEVVPSAAEIQIDRRFFDRPGDLPLLADSATLLSQWLALAGVGSHVSAAIAERLPAYFVFALNQEWRSNAAQYAPLLEAVETPFAKAGERELAWRAYASLLQRRVEEGVFDEPFSLLQLYVPLRAYYSDEPPGRSPLDEDRTQRLRVVVDLEQELTDWIATPSREDAIRVISGGPGSGKSSFARIFAARLAAGEKLRVLFIPLHLIDPDREMGEAVGRFIKDEGVLVDNPLAPDSPEPNLLIVFDGLDELASQGKAAAEAARGFIREVERTVEKRNAGGVKLRVLISGRELVVQENESEFRRARQILNLLPYLTGKEDKFEDPAKLLLADQRQDWWRRYGVASGPRYDKLPEALSREDLEEITAQPLLNYLVALSFTRGKLDFAKTVNLNQIYYDLLVAVYERAYEKKRAFTPIRHMKFQDFVRILEEIGLAAWHGDGRTTTIREIEEHCKASGVGRLLEAFTEGAKAGVTRLLAAFFFRQYGRRSSGDPTFVFTHKSFGEYLAARRVVRAMDRIERERRTSDERDGEGWGEREALRHWAEICGPSEMSLYLHQFLIDEIALQAVESIGRLQDVFTDMFSQMLRNSMPMELLPPQTFGEALRQSRNAEEALLAALNACARRTERISRIDHPNVSAFGTWLRRIQGQWKGEPSLVALCLSFLYLVDTDLLMSDLAYADLSHSDLSNANVNFARFYNANLDDAIMAGTSAARCYFWDATLRRAQLRNVWLRNSVLGYANLEGAVVRETDFSETNMEGMQLDGVDADDAAREAFGLPPNPSVSSN